MIDLSFPKVVNRLGIEWEGFYRVKGQGNIESPSIRDLVRDGLLEVGRDGSFGGLYGSNFEPFECRTTPLLQAQANIVLRAYQKAFERKEYYTGTNCGLHFHISFKENYFGYICRQQFYTKFCTMVEQEFRSVWLDRSRLGACQYIAGEGINYIPDSEKYRPIKYSHREHGTCEFRLFGGKHATPARLAECIQKTMDIISNQTRRGYKTHHKIVVSARETRDETKEIVLNVSRGVKGRAKDEMLLLYNSHPRYSEIVARYGEVLRAASPMSGQASFPTLEVGDEDEEIAF